METRASESGKSGIGMATICNICRKPYTYDYLWIGTTYQLPPVRSSFWMSALIPFFDPSRDPPQTRREEALPPVCSTAKWSWSSNRKLTWCEVVDVLRSHVGGFNMVALYTLNMCCYVISCSMSYIILFACFTLLVRAPQVSARSNRLEHPYSHWTYTTSDFEDVLFQCDLKRALNSSQNYFQSILSNTGSNQPNPTQAIPNKPKPTSRSWFLAHPICSDPFCCSPVLKGSS